MKSSKTSDDHPRNWGSEGYAFLSKKSLSNSFSSVLLLGIMLTRRLREAPVQSSGSKNSRLTARSIPRLQASRSSVVERNEKPKTLKPGSLSSRKSLSSEQMQQLRAPAGPSNRKPSQFYPFITGFPFPLGPLFSRETIRRQVDKDVWCFEQTQALESFSVYTPVRMTVIRLKSGGLWVHAPVAPTEECIALVKELGNVEYIVLPTFAYEHKVFVGPFSRRFPNAKVNPKW